MVKIMANKSKKELKKIYRERYKEIHGEEWTGSNWSPSVGGAMPKRSRKDYKITNQKGAFGKVKASPTFDPSETNRMRHKRRRAEAEAAKYGNKTIIEGAKGLLTKVLGE